jgi:short-subunit dehydrogenase
MSKVILVTGNESLVRLHNIIYYWVIGTGANTGIGYELVRLLAQKGHKVYLGARKPAAGREAA